MVLPPPRGGKSTMPTTTVARMTSHIQLLGMTGPGRRRWPPGGGGFWRGGMDDPRVLLPFSSLNLNRPKHFHSRIAKARRADYTVYELAEAVSEGQVRAAMDILVDSTHVLVAARKRPGA